MSFPHDDEHWVQVADFLDAHRRAGERVLAPEAFGPRLPDPFHPWVNDNFVDVRRFAWVVVHKGEMQDPPAGFLHQLVAVDHPVLANAVFVVWTTRDDVPTIAADDPHLRAFEVILTDLPDTPPAS